jgi:predicted transcriptional regulator
MPDAERLWTAIPVGEDRAETAAEIWRRYDLGARDSMRQMLNQLTAEGRIKRKARPTPSGAKMYLYYRAAE